MILSDLQEAKGLLYTLSGVNPFNDKNVNKDGLDKALEEALKDGLTRKELEDILKKYYGFRDVDIKDSVWEAFTGKKSGESLNSGDLLKSLRFFQKYQIASGSGYDLKTFFDLDKVYVVGCRDIGPVLQSLNLNKSADNPEVARAWEGAKIASGSDESSPRTWEWFGTLLANRFAHNLKEQSGYDIGDLDLQDPMARQLFGKYTVRWAKTNVGMDKQEWDQLKDRQKGVKAIGLPSSLGVTPIRLYKPEINDQDIQFNKETEKMLDDVIALQKDPTKVQEYAKKRGELIIRLSNISPNTAAPVQVR